MWIGKSLDKINLVELWVKAVTLRVQVEKWLLDTNNELVILNSLLSFLPLLGLIQKTQNIQYVYVRLS